MGHMWDVQVVEEARAVVLAGGTLQPISELRDRLFPQLPDEKVHALNNPMTCFARFCLLPQFTTSAPASFLKTVKGNTQADTILDDYCRDCAAISS